MEINNYLANQDLKKAKTVDLMQDSAAQVNKEDNDFLRTYQSYNDKINTKDQVSKDTQYKSAPISQKSNLYSYSSNERTIEKARATEDNQTQEVENASEYNEIEKSNEKSEAKEKLTLEENKDYVQNYIFHPFNPLSSNLATFDINLENTEQIASLEAITQDLDLNNSQTINGFNPKSSFELEADKLVKTSFQITLDKSSEHLDWPRNEMLSSFEKFITDGDEEGVKFTEVVASTFNSDLDANSKQNIDNTNEAYLNLPISNQRDFNSNFSEKDSEEDHEAVFQAISLEQKSSSSNFGENITSQAVNNVKETSSNNNDSQELEKELETIDLESIDQLSNNQSEDDELISRDENSETLNTNLSPFAEKLIKDSKQVGLLSKVEEAPTLKPIDQVRINIEKAIESNDSKISVVLHPEALGQVDIAMEIIDGKIKNIEINAERSDTLEMLQQEVKELQKALHEVTKSEEATLSFNLKQGNGENGYEERQAKQNYFDIDRKVVSKIVQSFSYIDGYLNTASTPGGVNIKV
jgi:hypothetical protein